jgi:Zn-dependent metalloprotease
MDDVYAGPRDQGGVHLNSGIPNHAFYRAAIAIGGRAWEKAGRIWYRTLRALAPTSGFGEMAERSLQEAAALFGGRSLEQKAVRGAWRAVGL